MSTGIPIFVVEGELEKNFIEKNCGKKIKILKISNGNSVSSSALAKQVYSLLRMQSIPPSQFVVLADRESRPDSSVKIENDVTNILKAHQVTIPFSVHVPDKMIENWIIADYKMLQNEKLEVDLKNGTEGCGGKAKIKEAYAKIGKKYSETQDGPNLLKKCSAHSISAVSPSFKRFHLAMLLALPQCYWLKK